jgi:uncharacterized protein DUF4232
MRAAERRHRRTSAAGAVIAVIIAVSLAGCVHDAAAPGGFTSSARPLRVTLPVKLNPDGSVPWVNAPATSADFLTRQPPPPPAVGPACRARQLTAVLSQWISGNVPGEPEDPVNRASLFGSVVLTNISDAPCTLSGTPSVRLLSSRGMVPLPYGKLRPASTPKVGLPAGGHASFPLAWDAPYCGLAPGPFTVDATLAGLSLRAAIGHQARPGCLFGGAHANGGLYAGQIAPGAPPAVPPPSPLQRLTAAAAGGPATVRPGQAVHFVVALTNPTSAPVSLAGRLGYSLEIFCRGTGRHAGLNYTLLYLLDNRPVPVITPHATIRFDMTAHLPAKPFPGPVLDVTWRLVGAAIAGSAPWTVLQMRTGR